MIFLIHEGYQRLINQNTSDALGCAVGVLISVAEAVVSGRDEDPTKQLTLHDTGTGRDVTISAKQNPTT